MSKHIKNIKETNFDFGVIALREDDILTFQPSANITTLNMVELEQMLNGLVDLCEKKPRPFFSNNKQMKSLGEAERAYVGKNIHRFATKSAIAENSPVVRFITHMIVHLHKPQIPMKMFKTEHDAIDWLKQ